MKPENGSQLHEGAEATVSLRRLVLRTLFATVVSPIAFCFGAWLGFYVTDYKPNPSLVASDPLLLLFLCPVFVAIAITSYIWRSRVMFIVASISVASLAPASQPYVRSTRGLRNIDFPAQQAMICGFIVAAGCCTLVAIVGHFSGGADSRSRELLD